MLVGQAMRDAGRFRTGSTIWLTLNCLCFSSSFSSHNLVYTYILSSNTTFPRQNRRQAVTASQLKLVELYDSQRRPGKSRRAAAANSNGRSWPTLGWW